MVWSTCLYHRQLYDRVCPDNLGWETDKFSDSIGTCRLFSQLPRIQITLFAGIIVDCFNRKRLMLLGDAIATVSY
ncbi:hypothetical protein [Chroogloeocystis siderophila]|uniref:hypothetical protein n=1 Tax=Chroogloeocystis siderophila TaxID=329163 RepID=UPI001F2EB95F|nr:hypothetical protein [Chroogloeocystis siderophila]